MTSDPMDNNENSTCDGSDKLSGDQPRHVDGALLSEYSLFERPTASRRTNASLIREPETNYALSKIHSLTAGVSGQHLSDNVNQVIQRIRSIDADGFLFAGDPCTLCGEISDDPNRPLCLIWMPGLGKQLLESVPHWVHIASSRLNQRLDQETDWFSAIRTVGVQSVGGHALLMTAADVTADPFICRIGKLFRVPVVRFEPLPTKLKQKWLTQQLNDTYDSEALRKGTPLKAFFHWLKKPRTTGDRSQSSFAKPTRADADHLLASLATMSLLLSVRNGGNVLAICNQRLQIRPGNATRILVNPNLTQPKITEQLMQTGAVGWWLTDQAPTQQPNAATGLEPGLIQHDHSQKTSILQTDFEAIKGQPFLIHWTRRRVGAWPDQTQDEYLDDLIFQSGRRRHNELAALCRILASRKILASNQLTRDRRPVTCLSDMTLREMVSKRVFRVHLSRWDFEPYGIAFKRNVFLRKFEAQPVIYGGEAEWQAMDESQKPYFQMRKSKGDKIDWQTEKEWRRIGDVDLNLVGPDDAVVFVARVSEIATLADLSIWPVVALEQLDQHESQNE